MRTLALGFSLALSGLGFAAASSGTAEACAMYRPHVVESTERLVAEAKRAESKGELRTAIRLYERAMNDDSARKAVRVEAAVKAGELQAKVGKGRESLRRFQKAVAMDAQSFPAQLGLGRAQAASGDLGAASVTLATAARLSTASFRERGDAQAALAAVLARLGRGAEAAAALQAARLLGASPESVADTDAAAAPEPFPAIAQQM